TTAPWARRSFDTATICIALVIFCVDLTEAIRFLRSLRDGIAWRLRPAPHVRARGPLGSDESGEAGGVGFDRRLELGFGVARKVVGRADRAKNLRVLRAQRGEKAVLERTNLVERQLVEITVDA